MKLIIKDNQGKTIEQELSEGTYKVGRGEGCGVLLDDETSSREHCVIEVLSDKCVLRDSGSMNGTMLNDKRVDEAELKEGDVIVIGQTTLTVSLAAPEGVAPEKEEGAPAEAAESEEPSSEAPSEGAEEASAGSEEAKPSESES